MATTSVSLGKDLPAADKKEKAVSFTPQERRMPLPRQLLLQLLLLFISFLVLFPILWVISMSLDPRGLRPLTLTLIPANASFDAYTAVMDKPTNNPVSFWTLARNSLLLASSVSGLSVLIGVFCAYAFSRFKFTGRQVLMLGIIVVLVLPAVASLAPLYVLLNRVQFRVDELNLFFFTLEDLNFNLRNSLVGVGFAMISGALPFAIWNLKGYIDTIPKDLEEAAMIDGASPNQTFFQIMLPLALPALAVTAFLGFLTGWTEFAISWQFLTNPQDFTLAMALWNMTGQYAANTPWSRFSAMAILVALPVAAVYLALQKYIVGGLTVGGVKG
jgi:arabinogalactan oligomer/maltooligosaccharide transport system permease protein